MTELDVLTSSLTALKTSLDRQSGNLATTNDPYGITQTTTLSTNVGAGKVLGLTASSPSFNVPKETTDAIVQFGGKAGYLTTLNEKLNLLEPFIGRIGGSNSLAGIFDGFKSALATFAGAPENQTIKKDLLQKAELFVGALNTFEHQIQNLRTSCEADITLNVTKIKHLLNSIADHNTTIMKANAQSTTDPVAFGKRLEALSELSQILSINVQEQSSGAVSITTCGITLLSQGAQAQVSFTQSVGINAAFTYPGQLQGLTVSGIDITNQLVSGKESQMGALFALRDEYLTNYSETIGQFASYLQDEVNAAHNNGSGFPANQTLTGTKMIQGTDAFYGNGSFRMAILNADGIVQNSADFNLSTYANVNAMIAAINAQFGAGTASIMNDNLVLQAQGGLFLAINENTSQMLDDTLQVALYDQHNNQILNNNYPTGGGLAAIVAAMNADFGVNATATQDGTRIYITPNNSNTIRLNNYPDTQSASIRSKGFSHYFGLNNFFSGESSALSPSIPSIISVSQNIKNDPGAISFSALSLTAAIGDRGITSEGLPTNNGLTPCENMRDVMSKTLTFQAVGGLGRKAGGLSDYFSSSLSLIANDTNYASEYAETSQASLNLAFTNFQKAAKQDMTQITQKMAEFIASIQTIAQALAKCNEVDKVILTKLA